MAILRNTVINDNTAITVPNNSQSTVGGAFKLRFSSANSTNTLEFHDGTDWRPVTGYSASIVGSGGTIAYIPGGGIVHIFTTVGSSSFIPAFTGNVQVLVVGGGGGGGSSWGGGGGGGGVVLNRNFPVVSGTTYPVSVGNGSFANADGQPTVFSSITASGGGQGGTWATGSPGALGTGTAGRPGGSGGGGSNTGDGIDSRVRSYGGIGVSGQGYPGGSGMRFNIDSENTHQGGGGGGAGGPGGSAPDGRQNFRGAFRSNLKTGGAGKADDILGTVLYWGGGGGGGGHLGWGDMNGGIGGGGGAGYHHAGPYGGSSKQSDGGGQALNAGTAAFPVVGGGTGGANTGGGGGAHNGTGGSGIVVVRY